MTLRKMLAWLLPLALVAVGCTTNEPDPQPETELPSQEEYVRLNFASGCGYNASSNDSDVTRGVVWCDDRGEGALTLKWESVAHDSEKAKLHSLIISDGERPICGKLPIELDSLESAKSYSALAVTPRGTDAHHADLQTVNYYASSALANAKYCYAIVGNTHIVEDAERGKHLCNVQLPSTFMQSASQEPGFLRESMTMYATAAYKGDKTEFEFVHIPATFRFIITNSKANPITLQEASITLSEGGAVASTSAELGLNWADGTADLAFGAECYEEVSVQMGDGALLSTGENYIAYTMALPLQSNEAFKGKTLNFNLKIDGEEHIALQLDNDRLAEINGSGICNWVSGNSYTIRINLCDDDIIRGEILADNRIEVSTAVSGVYTLLYERADGKVLSNYAAICTLTVDQLAYYTHLIDVNIAPRGAEAIGIYDFDGIRQGTIPLATLSNPATEAPLYSFGLLSDVHLGRAAIYPEVDFRNALTFFKNRDVRMACICGDISQNGKEEEFSLYQEITSQANIPVYTVTGNHDCTSSGEYIDTELWSKYTGLPLVFEKTVEVNGRVDHFLFLGMARWKFSSTIYLEESILWLAERLEEYRNDRCFIFTHPFFPDRAGNLNEIYPSGNWLKGAQLTTLQKLCDNYPNTVWFSGHSHWEWILQTYQDRANIYRVESGGQRASGWCVHVPSCGAPITSDGTTRVDNVLGSEGAVVEVYNDCIEILGVDLRSGKYLPIATYRLDTSLQNIAEKSSHYLSAKDFMENPSKTGCVVTDVEDMPNYVEVTFTAKGQGFYVANDTYFAEATAVKIVVEDVQAFSNGEPIDVPENVGFYGNSTYYLTDTYSAGVTHNSNYWGVQFQTSKSKYGDAPLPLTLRMKAQMLFY